MGYLLLWIEMVCLFVLLTALGGAIIARIRRKMLRIGVWVLWLLLLLTLVSTPIAGFGWLANFAPIYTKWFYYMLALGAVSVVVGGIVTYRGMKSREDRPAAASWSIKWIAVASVVAVGLHCFTIESMYQTMQERLMQLRAESTAIVLAAAPQHVPNNENAALWYQRLAEVLPENEKEPDDYKKWCDWLDEKAAEFDPNDQGLRDYLKAKRSAIALMHRAAQKPSCYYERHYANPSPCIMLPELHWMRVGSRLLALDARIQVADKHFNEALVDVATMLQMANHMRTEPYLVGVLVSIAIDEEAINTLEYVLASSDAEEWDGRIKQIRIGQISDSVLKDPLRYSDAMARAVKTEEGSGLWAFSSFDEAIAIVEGYPPIYCVLPAYSQLFLMPDDIKSYRRAMSKVQNYGLTPYHQNVKERKGNSLEEEIKNAGIITRTITPALYKCYEAAAKGDARRGLALLAVACERYKIARGEYPKSIDELTAEFLPIVPYDPFDGKPLKMVKTDGGLVLYSVGPDAVDQKGQELNKKGDQGDITFCLGDAYAARRLKGTQ